MRFVSLIAASVAAAVLAGCAGVSNESTIKQRQLDATTYEVEVMQAWVKDETMMREEARRQATNFCLETKRNPCKSSPARPQKQAKAQWLA